jgi:uncharacterized protein
VRPIPALLPAVLLLLAGSAGCDSGKAKASPCAQRGGLAPGQPAASQEVPRLAGRVMDIAGILSPQAEAELTARSAALERKTSDQLVVVTTPDLRDQPIEAYGLTLGNRWGIGRKDLANGALLIVAPNDRRVRIEVGCGLEGLLTNDKAAAIIDADLLPRLRRGEYDAATKAGVDSMIHILESDRRRPQFRAGKARS